MKQLSFILLITILTLSSCEDSNSTSQEIETSNIEKVDSKVNSEPETIVDSIVQKDQDSIQIIEKTTEPKDTSVEKKESEHESKAINIEDAQDVNKNRNVRDDPDYIGTPCEMVNGECIRHDHKNQEELPKNLEEDL